MNIYLLLLLVLKGEGMILQCVCDCFVVMFKESGICDVCVIDVICNFVCYYFIDQVLYLCVYENIVLLIGYGQIILQLWVVVWMIEVLLEFGVL